MSNEAFDVICRFDEAIDSEAATEEDKLAFRETFDPKHLRFIEGESPTVFHCRRLKLSEMRAVMSEPDDSSRLFASFARGVVAVDDLRIEGGRTRWTRPTDKPLLTDTIDKAGFSIAEVQEVGAAIFGRSQLGKGRPAAWPLPGTSRLAIEAIASRRVAQKDRREMEDSAKTRLATAQLAQSSAPVTATPGHVTATASAEHTA